MDIEKKIHRSIQQALEELNIEVEDILLEHPTDIHRGDFSTNVALTQAKSQNANPRELAERIATQLQKSLDKDIEKVEIAGPGFINFFLSKRFFEETLEKILSAEDNWGKLTIQQGKRIMVEYTDPNPFKVFHIGHLMNNTVGESIARLIEYSGAMVVRANYQGDIGPHVAKTLWGLQNGHGSTSSAQSLGAAYVSGSKEYEKHKEAINAINRALYRGDDEIINALYEEGKKVSLAHFEKIYAMLGTSFDTYFFESEVWSDGVHIVKQHIGKVFEESQGAVVFKGEEHDKTLHTRVFINSDGLPTYEAKEIGLIEAKEKSGNFDQFITITADEQKEYFKVVLFALGLIDPHLAQKIQHISHGILKLPTGKMSSRTGDVISGEEFIQEVKNAVLEIETDRDIEDKEKNAEIIAIGAIKYMILRQNAGKDIIYDIKQSLSLEGDSGPYLQYAYTRAHSLLEKKEAPKTNFSNNGSSTELEKLIYRFPSVIARALERYESHQVTTYLTSLAGAFNSFYAQEKIISGANEAYNLALTHAFMVTMEHGLYILGIKTPKRM